MKSTVTEIKISLQGFKDRFEKAEKESANLKIGQWKLLFLRNRKKKRLKKSEQSQRDLWDMKWTNILTEESQKEKREKR